jgi:hypothetical protein
MMQEILENEKKDKSTRKVLVIDDEINFCDPLKRYSKKTIFLLSLHTIDGMRAKRSQNSSLLL